MACARVVDQRVAIGGHDVPRDRIASQFERSLDNLAKAIALVPAVQLYDNSSFEEPYRLVATFEAGSPAFRMPGAAPRWARTIIGPARRKR